MLSTPNCEAPMLYGDIMNLVILKTDTHLFSFWTLAFCICSYIIAKPLKNLFKLSGHQWSPVHNQMSTVQNRQYTVCMVLTLVASFCLLWSLNCNTSNTEFVTWTKLDGSIRQCNNRGLWAALWQPVWMESNTTAFFLSTDKLSAQLQQDTLQMHAVIKEVEFSQSLASMVCGEEKQS